MLQSMYLEDLSRRDDFRAARQRLESGCQQPTLLGHQIPEVPEEDAPTLHGELPEFLIHDGKRAFTLSPGVNTIGRLSDNAVIVNDVHASRRHCAVVIHRTGLCELYDIASKNGTLINGVKINGPTRIRPGDTISICSARLVLLVQDPPKPAS